MKKVKKKLKKPYVVKMDGFKFSELCDESKRVAVIHHITEESRYGDDELISIKKATKYFEKNDKNYTFRIDGLSRNRIAWDDDDE